MSHALRRAAIVLIVWGLWLGCLTAVQPWFHPQSLVQWFLYGLLGGASFCCVFTGVAMLLHDLRRRGRAQICLRALVEESATTAVAVAGLAIALLGANFGLWMVYTGAGLGALGLAGIVREERARRRTLAWARERFGPHGRPIGAPPRRERKGPGRDAPKEERA
jgi:MFS family permease